MTWRKPSITLVDDFVSHDSCLDDDDIMLQTVEIT